MKKLAVILLFVSGVVSCQNTVQVDSMIKPSGSTSGGAGDDEEDPHGDSQDGPDGGSAADQASNFQRLSGEATLIQFENLFNLTTDDRKGFIEHTSSGLSRLIANNEKPAHNVAQMGLKNLVNRYCSSMNSWRAFSEDQFLMPGEKFPSSEATKQALLYARRIWLAPYTAVSPEVRLLSDLYTSASDEARKEGKVGDQIVFEAKRTLCVATLMAPQFWLGSPGPADAVRKIALEMARRLPTFNEVYQITQGKLSLKDYVKSIQDAPNSKYYAAVKTWHQASLGLRAMPSLNIFGDPRSFQSNGPAGAIGGRSSRIFAHPQTGGYRVIPSLATTSENMSEKCDWSRAQDFDPRTVMILWEHYMPVRGAEAAHWESVGAWVKKGFESFYIANARILNRAATMNDLNSLCRDYDPNYTNGGRKPKGFEGRDWPDWDPGRKWLLCDGIVSGPSVGTQVRVGLMDIHAVSMDYKVQPPALAYEMDRMDFTGVARDNKLAQSAHARFQVGQRRVRRFAPSGEQNGYSMAKTMFSETPVAVCNIASRLHLTCLHRPTLRAFSHFREPDQWNAYAPMPEVSHPYNSVQDSIMHPYIHQVLHCGNPDIYGSDEASAYPYGYDMNEYANLTEASSSSLKNPPNQSLFNPFLINAHISNTGSAEVSRDNPELEAFSTLRRDLFNEPYYLLEYILKNNRSYKELVTARYTFGHRELELFYRSNGYMLVQRPSGYQHSSGAGEIVSLRPLRSTDGTYKNTEISIETAPVNLRKIDFDQFGVLPNRGIEASLVLSSTTNNSHQDITHRLYWFNNKNRSEGILPNTSSGVLTMAAFLDPVSTKMRTVSSRFFLRFLCGEPNVFRPTSSQQALHDQFVPVHESSNGKLHLDKNSTCYSCHVNLDPLASALSSRFLTNVGRSEFLAMIGEISPKTGSLEQPYGIHRGGNLGRGAFLGKEVRGFSEVGQTMADSKLFAECAVRRAFENIYGRSIFPEDLEHFNQVVEKFMTHYNYNWMLQDLVDLETFSRRN